MIKLFFIFLSLIITSLCFGQVNLNLGLKAYFPFSGNANDASGNNNNPVFNNATLTADRLGNPNSAYHFNGVNNYIQVPNNPTLNMGNKISMSLWVKPTGYNTNSCYNNMLVAKSDPNNVPSNYFIVFADVYTGCTNPTTTQERFHGQGPVAQLPLVQLNQWYSVAWTFDGNLAKIYVNCILRDSLVMSTTSFTNSFDLYMGKLNGGSFPFWFNGDLDEVRIYDRALNVDEVKVLGDCAPSSYTINDYTPVTNYNICENKITVEDAIKFNAGDTVVMMQMKGAVIDSSNTAAFGTITDYKNAGNYEFNYVKSKSGNIIELKNRLNRQYDIPTGKVQLIRVPYFNSYNVTSTLSCLPWNGKMGGVLILDVRDTVNLNANVDVSGNGFQGGIDPVTTPPVFNCYENQYFYPPNPDLASGKGEGIADISAARSFGKGALANGGGGGNSHNSGGAGGGNISAGGMGGYQFEGSPCDGTVPFDNRGISGTSLTYSNAANKLFMGGGGGAGHTNNPEGFQAIGGNGAGIIIILTDKLKSNSFKIIADGNNANGCGLTTSGCHEGMGGGGAGGNISLKVNSYLDNTSLETKGGKGGDMTAVGFSRVGPGGGGSGGLLWLSNSTLPANFSVVNTGGSNGVCTGYANNPWGATAGQPGSTLLSLQIPVDNIAFKKNIDSVRIKDSATSCRGFDFKGLAYTNTYAVNTWLWSFGDGSNAFTQNPTHLYPAEGSYTVVLVVTDINGCKDTITKNITTIPAIADAGIDTTICTGTSVTLHASAGTAYSWSPSAFLNNSTIQNPVASVTVSTLFHVTVTNALGCNANDSVLISVTASILPTVTISTITNTICRGKAATFLASASFGGGSPTFEWLKNGITTGTNSNTYSDNNLNDGDIIKCRLTSTISCASPATVESNQIVMTIILPPANTRYPTVSTLANHPLQLQARTISGSSYLWQPSTGLNNTGIINPLFTYNQSLEYRIFINTPVGCQVVDTQLVKISGTKGIYVPRGFSPNGNGINDRLYPILVGINQLFYFRVYNRWGNLLFETNSGNPASGWDGKFKGVAQLVESYTWTAEAIDIDGIMIKKSGNTFLIR